MAVPYTFATQTTSIPLAELDTNFSTPITIGTTVIPLGNVAPILENVTLGNVVIASGNVTLTNVNVINATITQATITTANVTTANITSAFITTANVTTANITTANVVTIRATTANIATANVTAMEAVAANVTTLRSTTINVTTANVTTAFITTANIATANVTTFNATTINVATANVTSVILATGYANVTVSASNAASQTFYSSIAQQNPAPFASTGAAADTFIATWVTPQLSNDGTGGVNNVTLRGIFANPQITSSGATARVTLNNVINAQRSYLTDISANTSNTLTGVLVNYGHAPTLSPSAVTGTATGLSVVGAAASGNITTYTGVSSQNTIVPTSGTVTIANKFDYNAIPSFHGNNAGNVTFSGGVYQYFAGQHAFGGSTGIVTVPSVTTFHANGIIAQANATVTNYYGVYLTAPTTSGTGVITNRYGIYQADTVGTNYFAANVGIGTSSPSSYGKLAVSGNIYAGDTTNNSDGTVTIGSSGAGSVAITRTGAGATQSALTFSTTFATLQERMRIDSSGNVAIGTATTTGAKFIVNANTAFPATAPPTGTALWVTGADAVNGRITLDTFGSAGNFSFRAANGTAAAPTASLANGLIGATVGIGYGTTAYSAAARSSMSHYAAENWTDSAQGTYQLFSTTAIGATTVTEKMRIDGSGNTYVETGNLWQYSPAPTALAAGANAGTAAQLLGGMFSAAQTTAVTLTMPTGTAIDTGFPTVPAVDIGFYFYVINTGSALGAVTVAVNTNVTSLGSLVVAIGTSAQFRLRRTAANTYVMYRLS